MTSINAVPVVLNSFMNLFVFYHVTLFKFLSCILSSIHRSMYCKQSNAIRIYSHLVILFCFRESRFSLGVFLMIYLVLSTDTQIKVFLHSNICRIYVYHNGKQIRHDLNNRQIFTVIIAYDSRVSLSARTQAN